MPTSLDDVMGLLRELLAEAHASRVIADVAATGPVAPSTDWEDPKVFFDLKSWRGEPCKGRKYSECPAGFLEAFALALTGMARKEQAERALYREKPAYIFTLQKASRARRWAIRKHLGWEPEAKADGEAKAPDRDTGFGGSTGFESKPKQDGAASSDDDASFNYGHNTANQPADDDDIPLT